MGYGDHNVDMLKSAKEPREKLDTSLNLMSQTKVPLVPKTGQWSAKVAPGVSHCLIFQIYVRYMADSDMDIF